MATKRNGSVLLAAMLVLGACASDSDDEQGADPSAASTTDTAAGSSSTENEGDEPVTTNGGGTTVAGGEILRSYAGTTYPPELTGIVDLAIADLARSVDGVAASAVNVVEVAEVTWSDAGLGCPEPGFSYAQVVTDGLRILLEAGGQTYDYRSGEDGEPRLCQPGAIAEAKPSTTIGIETDGTTTVTTVTTAAGDVTTIVTKGSGGEDEPTEGINPPDE